jgi:hypothetical protein
MYKACLPRTKRTPTCTCQHYYNTTTQPWPPDALTTNACRFQSPLLSLLNSDRHTAIYAQGVELQFHGLLCSSHITQTFLLEFAHTRCSPIQYKYLHLYWQCLPFTGIRKDLGETHNR